MKRNLWIAALGGLLSVSEAVPQGRPVDWPNFGGDAQRTGWEKSDSRITRDNVKDFRMVLKKKIGSGSGGQYSLTPPVVLGQLISYKGFKELAFVQGAGDKVYALDADVERMFWESHPSSVAAKPKDATCAGIAAAMPALTPPVAFGAGRPRPAAGAPANAPAPVNAPPRAPIATATDAAEGPKPLLGSTGFGAPRPLFALLSDGKLHVLNTSTGEETVPAVPFLPANAKASPLTVADSAIYTATSSRCGDSPNAVWAIDLSTTTPSVASYPLKESGPSGIAGLAVGTDGTVFVQTAAGPVLSLSSKELKPKQTYTPAGNAGSNTTPVVFTYKDRELVVSAGKDGRLSLIDGQTMTLVSQSPALTSSGQGVWGGLSTWQNADGSRWVLAPVWGPLSSDLKTVASNGPVTNGAIVALQLEEHDGKPMLTPAWASRDMISPVPPMLTGGMVFALSAGKAG